MTESIGTMIRNLRKDRKVSQRALAAEVGLHFASISKIENGKETCGEDTLKRIAKALGADVNVFLGIAGHRTMPYRVLGNIAAGTPIDAIEDVETFSLTDQFDPHDHYMLRVRGESMILAGINDGDMAIVRHSTNARNGDIVVAIVGDEEATLKTYTRRDHLVVLSPANRALHAKAYPAAEVQVRGVLAGVLRTSIDHVSVS